MSLRHIQYEEDYRSGEHNILKEFFQTSLSEARTYWRAVGYFSSTALEMFGAPLANFIQRDGSIRLITSVELSQSDYDAIQEGISQQEICEQRIQHIIEEELPKSMSNGIAILGALLKIGRLQIKIAVPKGKSGIYHEKVGVFFDETDDYVAFSGSSNESRNAFEENIETIDVFPSWDSPSRARRKREHFERLWQSQAPGVLIFSFPEASARALITLSERHGRPNPQPRQTNNKWRHQDEAVDIFLEKERGILDMATGTGKTRTALRIARHLLETDRVDTVIVSTFGTDLLKQWRNQLVDFIADIDRDLFLYQQYEKMRELADFNLDSADAMLLCSRTNLASALRNLSTDQGNRTLLIHDEVHGLGSASNRQSLSGLSDHIRYRLGLSATPEREYDSEGNQFVEEHIGPVLFEFGLKEAIERGILAPFNYYTLPYQASTEDGQKIKKVYSQKAARAKEGRPMSKQEVWTAIARVHKESLAKIPVFRDFISLRTELIKRCIVFVETMAYGDELLDMIHQIRPDFHTYYSGEHEETLKRFAEGELECLVTCHRLSEGIDIQSLETVIVFSSARARLETIQRIGRCLRVDPNNPNKVANIVDFIRQGHGTELTADEQREQWLATLSKVRPIEQKVS